MNIYRNDGMKQKRKDFNRGSKNEWAQFPFLMYVRVRVSGSQTSVDWICLQCIELEEHYYCLRLLQFRPAE